MLNLIEFIVKKLVDKPEAVVVSKATRDGKSIVEVKVSPHDLSNVIGSEGRTFRALKTLLTIRDGGYQDLVVDSVE